MLQRLFGPPPLWPKLWTFRPSIQHCMLALFLCVFPLSTTVLNHNKHGWLLDVLLKTNVCCPGNGIRCFLVSRLLTSGFDVRQRAEPFRSQINIISHWSAQNGGKALCLTGCLHFVLRPNIDVYSWRKSTHGARECAWIGFVDSDEN